MCKRRNCASPKSLSGRGPLIETVNDQLKNICQIEHSRHRSPINAFVYLIAGLIAYTWQEKRPALSWTREEQEILNAHEMLVCVWALSQTHVRPRKIAPSTPISRRRTSTLPMIWIFQSLKVWPCFSVIKLSGLNFLSVKTSFSRCDGSSDGSSVIFKKVPQCMPTENLL